MEQMEQRINELYKLANTSKEDSELKDAVAIIKYLRRSVGQHNRYKQEYLNQATEYKETIVVQSLEIEEYQKKIQELAVQKKQAIENLNKATRELERIDSEIKVAVARVKHEKTWFGKFSRLLDFFRTLFLEEDDIQALLEVDYSHPNKPQMNTDIASIQRDLYDQ